MPTTPPDGGFLPGQDVHGVSEHTPAPLRAPERPPRFWLFRFWDSFIAAPLRKANEECRQYLNTPAAVGLDGKVVTILIVVAVMLIFQHYLLSNDVPFLYTMILLREIGLGRLADWWVESLGEDRRTWLLYWAVGNFVLYVVIPGLIVKLVFRQKLGDYGFKLQGAFKDWWVYPLFLAIMLPIVFFVSRAEHFRRTYPFYHVGDEQLWPWFWVWELFYALQFIGLEFFFRGFMVHGLRHRFGAYSIPVMMVPYCMIHFQKPIPETFGAIVAGFVLGFMSLRTRSVILGAALHVGVAVSMDMTSLWRQGYFGAP